MQFILHQTPPSPLAGQVGGPPAIAAPSPPKPHWPSGRLRFTRCEGMSLIKNIDPGVISLFFFSKKRERRGCEIPLRRIGRLL